MDRRKTSVAALSKWLDREAQRVSFEAVNTRSEYLRNLVFEQALSGDESFAESALVHLFWRVAHDKMDATDRAVLACMLERASKSDAARKAICGAEKRGGQARRGMVGLSLAVEVSAHIRKERMTAERAWEVVGQAHHLTASAIKGHWVRWKPTLLSSAANLLREHYPEADEPTIKARARVLILGDRA